MSCLVSLSLPRHFEPVTEIFLHLRGLIEPAALVLNRGPFGHDGHLSCARLLRLTILLPRLVEE